jgi:hypothetical protein
VPRRSGEYFISFDVLDREAPALQDATGVKWDERVGGVITKEPSDGSAYVVFQVRADDEDAAYGEALEAYGALRSDAGLDPAPPLGGAVVLLRAVDETDETPTPLAPPVPLPSSTAPTPPRRATRPHERWLERARELLAFGDHDYATVAAQTACEVVTAETMRQLIAKHAHPLQVAIEKLVAGRFSLAHDPVRALWADLTGDAISKAAFWEPYTRHRVRRNRIVHEGQSVTAQQAAESVKIAQELCTHVIGFAP